MRSTVTQIRERFDNDVERFSDLETGQTSTVDAALAMRLVADAAAAVNPDARSVLDVGCGAGNYTLALLQRLPGLDTTLLDLSRPMLGRASERVAASTSGRITTVQGDIREVPLGGPFDIVLAAAVLHHLRSDEEWRAVFRLIHDQLNPGGSFWIFDMVDHSNSAIHGLLWRRYGDYLTEFRDAAYRDQVFEYIEAEDSPRPLVYQLDLLTDVGFTDVDILHKNGCFAAFGAQKPL